MAESLASVDARTGWRWLRWRLLVLLAVFGAGLLALSSGAGVSDRVLEGAGLLTRVYYTLGLFVFGGMDLGIPQGGPAWARGTLWFVYFAAPAITTSAVVEAVLRALQPRAWWRRRLRGHVVVVGCGRLALLYLQHVRDERPRQPVVVVERDPDAPLARQAAARLRVHLLAGDASDPTLLDALRLEHAERVALLTGDDHVNLDAAARVLERAPHLAGHTLAHVADIRLLRVIERRGLLPGVRLFNSYRTAARHLVEVHLRPHFEQTVTPDALVLAGFGRYGQTVLDELQQRARGHLATIVLVDLEAERRAAVFDEQVGFAEGVRREVVQADLRDPRVWGRVDGLLGPEVTQPVFVLCSGDDGTNLRAALRLSSRTPRPLLLARCFHRSTFTDRIGAELGFEIVSTSELLAAHLDREGLAGAPDATA